jgi:hypothetical protein
MKYTTNAIRLAILVLGVVATWDAAAQQHSRRAPSHSGVR